MQVAADTRTKTMGHNSTSGVVRIDVETAQVLVDLI